MVTPFTYGICDTINYHKILREIFVPVNGNITGDAGKTEGYGRFFLLLFLFFCRKFNFRIGARAIQFGQPLRGRRISENLTNAPVNRSTPIRLDRPLLQTHIETNTIRNLVKYIHSFIKIIYFKIKKWTIIGTFLR